MTESAGQRALVYVRQSLARGDETEDSSLSLAFQERECRVHATGQGWAVLDPVIRDHDISGNVADRPGIAELFARVERDRPDLVIVYSMSRFARDYLLAETMWRKLKAAGVELVSIKEPHAGDDLMRGILSVIAQAERNRIGGYIRSAHRERARRGLPHGRAPFGYRKDDEGRLAIVPEEAEWIPRIIERLEAGWSVWRVTGWLNEQGVDAHRRTWKPIAVLTLLRNPKLAGAVQCGDVTTWDAHPPILARPEWERLQDLLATRRTVRTKSASSWLEGVIECACGSPMHLILRPARGRLKAPTPQFRCTANILRGNQWNHHVTPCTAARKSIHAHLAESGTVAALLADLERITDPATVYAEARRVYTAFDANGAASRKRAERALAKVQAERDRLLLLYTRGTLDVARWEAMDGDLGTRVAAAEAELAAIPTPPDLDAITARHRELLTIRETCRTLALIDPAELRLVLQAAGAVVVVQADGVAIRWPAELAGLIAR